MLKGFDFALARYGKDRQNFVVKVASSVILRKLSPSMQEQQQKNGVYAFI